MDKAQLAQKLRGRTPEQQKVIKYFFGAGGCLGMGLMKDEEYDALVAAKLSSTDFKKRALDKIGLDESEVSEITPVNFGSYVYSGNVYKKLGADNVLRSSAYQITWIFFSANQVYLYQHTFNMDEDGKKETTDEYFYKDIVNFNVVSDTVEVERHRSSCTGSVSVTRETRDYDKFTIVVPGDKLYCSLKSNDTTEAAIKGMKALLREKKNNG